MTQYLTHQEDIRSKNKMPTLANRHRFERGTIRDGQNLTNKSF